MTSARLKRLRQLEQERERETAAHIEALTSRAMDRMTPEELADLGREMDTRDTPEYEAAVSRLLKWGEQVPEVRDAPDLGNAAKKWWERMHKAGAFSRVPVASVEVAEQLEAYAEQWRSLSEREDCPEREAARGLTAAWLWWSALAWESRAGVPRYRVNE